MTNNLRINRFTPPLDSNYKPFSTNFSFFRNMHWKLILICLSLIFLSCRQPSTNLVYFHDIVYKHLFTRGGSLYGHVLFVKNYKTHKVPTQKELEEFAIYYSYEQNKKESIKKIDYIKFISEQFAQSDEIDEYRIARIYLQYENDEIKIKKFYQY